MICQLVHMKNKTCQGLIVRLKKNSDVIFIINYKLNLLK